jgi:hypothetical protein
LAPNPIAPPTLAASPKRTLRQQETFGFDRTAERRNSVILLPSDLGLAVLNGFQEQEF